MQLPRAVDVVAEAGNVARLADVSADLWEEIDDLAKYRVILYLLRNPWTAANAKHYATILGFHSPDRTSVLLDELYLAGLVTKREVPGDEPIYGLTPDTRLRRRLRQFCYCDESSPEYETIVRRLAQRSVARTQRERKRNGKGS